MNAFEDKTIQQFDNKEMLKQDFFSFHILSCCFRIRIHRIFFPACLAPKAQHTLCATPTPCAKRRIKFTPCAPKAYHTTHSLWPFSSACLAPRRVGAQTLRLERKSLFVMISPPYLNTITYEFLKGLSAPSPGVTFLA